MLAGPPENHERDARHVRLGLQAGCEPALRHTAATAGAAPTGSLDWVDRPTRSWDPSARSRDIWIDQSHRLLVASGSRDRQGTRAVYILIALAAAFAVAFAGTLSGYRLFNPAAVSSPPVAQSPSPSAGIASAIKGDRLEVHRAITRQVDRDAPAQSATSPNLLAATTIAHWKPSSAVSSAPSAGDHSSAAQPPPPSPAARPAIPKVEARLTPVPETRPTTIDGWVLREVVDGTAVLEGPGGIWRVKRGDTLPGMGKVLGILRWGNRAIVATNRGLISTP